MRIDTPQILWHNGSEGNGKAAPLYSVSLLPYAHSDPDGANESIKPEGRPSSSTVEVLATAGNTNEIHLWKLSPSTTHLQQQKQQRQRNNQQQQQQQQQQQHGGKHQTPKSRSMNQPKIIHASKNPAISHHLTLTRHERSINALAFSPHGTHLATAGDGGSLLFYSVPHSYRNTTHNNNTNININTTVAVPATHSYWTHTLQTENDLLYKVVPTHAEDIMDVSWSNDEQRLVVGTLDHSVLVFQNTILNTNNGPTTTAAIGGSTDDWTCVYRNEREHTQYVQGVSFDPVGVYMASQGSDRTVRVWMRKRAAKTGGRGTKKKVLAAVDRNAGDLAVSQGEAAAGLGNWPDGKFEIMPKPKVLKYRIERHTVKERVVVSNEGMAVEGNVGEEANGQKVGGGTVVTQKKHHLFADESTVESFFRRLAWTVDGAFLITPASIWKGGVGGGGAGTAGGNSATPSFAVYLFARHHFDRPYKVLSGFDKPAVVVRPNPVLFQLPIDAQLDSKENIHASSQSPPNNSQQPQQQQHKRPTESLLPYRSIFAVLTLDTILIYDTFHSRPLCIAQELHYAGLTDCSWSSNGRNLIVCSTDGYISILSFDAGELGEIYIKPPRTDETTTTSPITSSTIGTKKPPPTNKPILSPSASVNRMDRVIPPCDPGQSAIIVAPPTKKARIIVEKEKRRVVPMLIPAAHVANRAFIATPPSTSTAMEHDGVEQGAGLCISRGIKRDIDASLVGTPSNANDGSDETVVVDITSTDDEEDGDSCSMLDREVLGGVTNLSLQQRHHQQQQNQTNTLVPVRKKKKKRIQPTLLRGN